MTEILDLFQKLFSEYILYKYIIVRQQGYFFPKDWKKDL